MTPLEEIKIILREEDIPFFTDAQLSYYLMHNNQDINAAVYECLLVKAEDTTLSVSGLSTADSSKYFRRMASRYRPRNSGVLKGVY